jgi:hypothetical protein
MLAAPSEISIAPHDGIPRSNRAGFELIRSRRFVGRIGHRHHGRIDDC